MRYILFDLDGTLTDPALGITNAVRYALERYRIYPATREELYPYIGPPLIDSFRQLAGLTADEARQALIEKDPAYASVVCRCEQITEGEIREAIRRGARSLDGVKRRVRAGMGRCQGGFCTPRVLELLHEELGIPMTELTKSGGDSRLLAGRTKEVLS